MGRAQEGTSGNQEHSEKGKKDYLEERMQKELEPRDKWLGIKELKQQFTPKMYERAHWNDDNKM
eukprot:283499-Karenia_brevis.AAC.1